MNVIILFKKKKYKINIHKLDSILCIKNISNKIIFHNENNLDDIQLYYNNKLLNDNDYCDKYNIKDNNILILHLKKKGGNTSKKIMFYIGCIIIILIPFFILPTGINTGGVSFIAEIMLRAKNEVSRYIICELKYKTLAKRIGTFIDIIKYFLLIMATYTLITIGCITACLMTKGAAITEDPKKICTPYYVGSIAGLVLTTLYFLIYFGMRFADKIIKPLENWASQNFVTNLLVRPFLKLIYSVLNQFKFFIVYLIPFVGQTAKVYHIMIDSIFPSFVLMLDLIATGGCSSGNIKSLAKNFEKKLNGMKNNIINGKENNNDKNNNSNQKNNNSNQKNNVNNKINIPNNLYQFQFQNGIIDNSKYEISLDLLRSQIKVEPHPLCKDPAGGSCCNRDKIYEIAEFFYNILMTDPNISQILKDTGLYFGSLLAIQGMYEKVLFNDDIPIIFENKMIVEKKILLKSIYQQYFEEFNTTNNGKGLLNSIEEIIFGKDEDFPDEAKFSKVEKKIFDYFHKDDLNEKENREKIKDIKNKITKLESLNIQYAEEEGSKYQAGDTPTKFFIKNIFIGLLCNIFTTADSGKGIVTQIGGLNELIDILKCGSGSGVIIGFIYLITVIVLIICGIFKIY